MELPDLSSVTANELSDDQIRGVLAQIDLDLMNLVRDGKLAALRYATPGETGQMTDRASNLRALLAARDYYQSLLNGRPAWQTSQAIC